MPFRFPLDAALKHRKAQRDIAERAFRVAESKLLECKDQLVQLEEQKEQTRQYSFSMQKSGGRSIGSLNQSNDFIKLQDLRIEQQKKLITEVQKQVEDLRQILRQKAIDTRIIERLKEKRKKEFKDSMAAKEQKNQDEMVTMRYNRK